MTVDGPHGVAVIDKPPGCTSHDVVGDVRRVLSTRKVGHSGTLDPDATGVLVLGVGRATRLLRFVTGLPKRYEAEFVLGVETSTLDASGEVTARHDMAHITDSDVTAAAGALVGEISQVPPMVSAVKVGGRRLHELARAGIEVQRPARPVTVYRFDVAPLGVAKDAQNGTHSERGADAAATAAATAQRLWHAVVECSSGTYVRSLVADLGHSLGGGAHLTRLRRSAVGSFTLAEARPPQQVELQPMRRAVSHLESVRVGADVEKMVRHGRVLSLAGLGAGETAGPWAVLDPQGNLLAVYEAHNDGAKPAVVVAGAG